MRKGEWIALALVVIAFIISAYFYPKMPESMASHWNAAGEADGYMPRFWALAIMPITCLLLFLLFLAIPRVDPLKENLEKFRGWFDGFVVLIIFFMVYLDILIIVWGMGIGFDMVASLVPAFAGLFYYCGALVGKAKRNWFVGIRTPWTLSSEKVWNKTHKRGGKLFKVCGVICLLGLGLQEWAIWIVIVPVIAVAGYLIVYSYLEYQKLPGKKK